MTLACRIALVALLAALPAAAQLHKCKDKSGRPGYQDTGCEDGTTVGKVQAPTGRPVPAGNPNELGLWETTLVFRPRQKTASKEELEALGMAGFLLGRPMKTVSCSDSPLAQVFADGSC